MNSRARFLFLRSVAVCWAVFLSGPAFTSEPAAVPARPAKPTLYVATLRPNTDIEDSIASGVATLLLNADESAADVQISYTNLSSAAVTGHLKLGGPTQEGVYVRNFSAQQPIGFHWIFGDTGTLTVRDVRAAIKDGRLSVVIASATHPAGEIRAQFIRSSGSQTFTPPSPVPAAPIVSLSARDAARFLTQATFGPTAGEIAALQQSGSPGRWIDEQMALPATSHRMATMADFSEFPPDKNKGYPARLNRQAAWWKVSITAPDQLRQRVAFALSEILVVSDVNGKVARHTEALAAYYDLLANDAFGNFRRLLEDVTRSPVMGAYLNALRSPKPDPKRNRSADENYAREVMQLFTIGLYRLQPDGTLQLDAQGLPIPTYNQQVVSEMARVFTGWGFYSSAPRPAFFREQENFFAPMMLYPQSHDNTAKTIIGGRHLPARQGGEKDLRDTLDALFEHPNTGPFICRQLIQRLVTSNPSPGYVYRVAQVFARNSAGERGDLGAVVRAILLDPEARSAALADRVGYGKFKEPLLRATALLRAFDATSGSGRILIPNAENELGQSPLHAPTVFNFFEPDYIVPGPLAEAGLYAPECKIITAVTAITVPNLIRRLVYTAPHPREKAPVLKLDSLMNLTRDPGALVDSLNLIFCSGSLSPSSPARIVEAVGLLPPKASDLDRARMALYLTVTSPEAAVQR